VVLESFTKLSRCLIQEPLTYWIIMASPRQLGIYFIHWLVWQEILPSAWRGLSNWDKL